MAELAQACRLAASGRRTGLADIEKAFHEAGRADKERLFGFDKVHLSPVGHALVAAAVLDAIARERR